MIIRLSYPMTEDMPLYPGTPPIHFHKHRSIDAGDSTNTHLITLHNHTGTHIDTPLHFCSGGTTITDCLRPEMIYSPAYCIKVEKSGDEMISVDDLADHVVRCKNAEAIILKTGGYRIRKEKPDLYSSDHPYISPKIPPFIREHFRNLRIFGIDQISISSVLHREEGRLCHREFLCWDPPILLAEDMDLTDNRIGRRAYSLRIYPHIIAGIDAVSVTAILDTYLRPGHWNRSTFFCENSHSTPDVFE